MPRTRLALLLGLAACGSGGGQSVAPAPEPPPAIIASSTSLEVRLNSGERVFGDVVIMSRDSAWTGLLAAYAAIGVPIASQNRQQGVVTSSPFRAPARLLNRRLGAFFDCGRTLTGARVDQWEVNVQLVSGLEPTNDGMRVSSRTTASARPRDGSSTAPVSCSSSGLLEKEVARLVKEIGASR